MRNPSLPGPRGIAVAILCLFGFGLLVGSGSSQSAENAGITRILLEGSGETAGEPPEPAASVPVPEAEPAAPVAAFTPEALPPAPAPIAPSAEPAPKPVAPPELPEEFELPEVKHVFLIVLAGHGFEEAFGATSPAPYLAKTLTSQGELLTNYYAVARGDLANEVALLSGQGPNPETVANCPTYTDIAPGTIGAEEQVEGNGCVYPAATPTLPGQLSTAGKKWKAYVEDIGNGEGQPTTCRHPAAGAPDPNQVPLPNDAYETWRNPFVYFHSLTDGPECAENDVGLDQLQTDLQAKSSTPSLSYIVPNACHDGSEELCAPEQPAGLAAAEPFLRTVVPEIKASPAYKDGGLIAITFAQAPETGPGADSSSCCATPEYPNLPSAEPATTGSGPVKPAGGGGRVGLLLISPFVKPKSVEETGYYNHFSLLLSIENLFGLERLGYASGLALSPFEESIFNAQAKDAG